MAGDVTLRDATVADAGAINDIYNHYVHTSTCTFQAVDVTEAERVAWLEEHDEAHPAVVAERDGVVVAWGSLSRFRARHAYDPTVEVSVYVDAAHVRQGLGRTILDHLIGRARAAGHHAVMALIAADQGASVALHARFGFTEVGRLREVGCKFDRWLDVIYMERVL